MTTKTKKRKFIRPEPISFIIGLGLFAYGVWYHSDLIGTLILSISFLLYGYSISKGKNERRK